MNNNKESRKEAIKKYKEIQQEMGIYAIRNLKEKKIFLGSTLNLDNIFHRYLMQLRMGQYPYSSLQNDFNTFGEEGFSFEIIDKLKGNDDPMQNNKAALEELTDRWVEAFIADGYEFYNKGIIKSPEKFNKL